MIIIDSRAAKSFCTLREQSQLKLMMNSQFADAATSLMSIVNFPTVFRFHSSRRARESQANNNDTDNSFPLLYVHVAGNKTFNKIQVHQEHQFIMYKFLCAPLASFPTVVCASTTRASGRSGKNPQNVFAVCLHVDFSFWVERKQKQHKSKNNESNSYVENLWSRKKCCGSMLEGGWFVCWMVIKRSSLSDS